jgi:hypothetical protein
MSGCPGAGNGYAHFAGTDGSKSFITGEEQQAQQQGGRQDQQAAAVPDNVPFPSVLSVRCNCSCL